MADHDKMLKLLAGKDTPTPDDFKALVTGIDSHEVLAKVFLLEGVPFVFKDSPMKYVIFREQVAERFGVGSHDVCIVGSAKLGFSPSPYKFGTSFSTTSDVDVVVVSESLFYRGSRELLGVLERLEPALYKIRNPGPTPPVVSLQDWRSVKEAVRNFVYRNFNPGLLPFDHALRIDIFSKISSTAGLFLALEPQVFVSTIRCRIFCDWKAAEDYYANTLRQAKEQFTKGTQSEADIDEEGVTLETASSVETGREGG